MKRVVRIAKGCANSERGVRLAFPLNFYLEKLNLLKSGMLTISTGSFQFKLGGDAGTRLCPQHK
jgi:hypothetical protein